MGTEVLKPYDSLKEELDRAKNNLKGLDENIRRIIGRDPQKINANRNDRNNDRKRGPNDPSRRNNDIDRSVRREITPPPVKRRTQDAKSVFSRLSGPPIRNNDSIKPRIHSRVIKELPTREEIVEAQGGDEQSRARNRRMFGCLLGTLQKFCQEESRLKTKEEKKAQIEKKLEEQELKERINMKKERQTLFIDRKRQQLEIRKLELKMTLLREFELWEKSKKDLFNFIKTKSKPHLYYRPKIINEKTEKILQKCRADLQSEIDKKKNQLNDEITEIENRFKLRDDEEELLAEWERSERNGEFKSRNFRRNIGNNNNNNNSGNYYGDEEQDDSNYDEDENSYDNEKKYSKSVVVTVQNNYTSESKENDFRNSEENIVIKKENEEKDD